MSKTDTDKALKLMDINDIQIVESANYILVRTKISFRNW